MGRFTNILCAALMCTSPKSTKMGKVGNIDYGNIDFEKGFIKILISPPI